MAGPQDAAKLAAILAVGRPVLHSNAHWFSRRTSSSSSGVKSFCADDEWLITRGTQLKTNHS